MHPAQARGVHRQQALGAQVPCHQRPVPADGQQGGVVGQQQQLRHGARVLLELRHQRARAHVPHTDEAVAARGNKEPLIVANHHGRHAAIARRVRIGHSPNEVGACASQRRATAAAAATADSPPRRRHARSCRRAGRRTTAAVRRGGKRCGSSSGGSSGAASASIRQERTHGAVLPPRDAVVMHKGDGGGHPRAARPRGRQRGEVGSVPRAHHAVTGGGHKLIIGGSGEGGGQHVRHTRGRNEWRREA